MLRKKLDLLFRLFQIKDQMTRLRQIVREMHETFCQASTLVPELEGGVLAAGLGGRRGAG